MPLYSMEEGSKMSEIREKAQGLQEYLVATRRHFHENPESSLKEYDTAA